MANTREGVLYYDKTTDRYDIVYFDGGYYGGLHCGNCFDLWLGDEWVSARIEADNDGWYLCDLYHENDEKYEGDIPQRLDGLKVRM